MSEPILIMAMPRSGSSMTAGIFAAHGVWTGTSKPPSEVNPKGTFEQQAIKRLIIKSEGDSVAEGRMSCYNENIHERIIELRDADGYEGGPWLWKGSALYSPLFVHFRPKWVVCRRDKEASFASIRDSRLFGNRIDDARLRRVIDIHHDAMDGLLLFGAAEVDTKAVANGDFTTIRAAVEYCGLEFDEKATREFVDPSLWRH